MNALVRPVRPGFALRSDLSRPELPPAVRERIQALWRTEQFRRPTLFDGLYFNAVRLEAERADGFLAPYSWRLAQRLDPTLRQVLNLHPLDVSGLSVCAGQVVFGRRGDHLAIDGGLWELCPSGTVHGDFRLPDGGLDSLAHAFQEAREELGLEQRGLRARSFALVETPETGVLDLGVALALPVSPDELLRLHRERGDGEYEALALVPLAEAPAFADSLGANLAPVSRALLAEFLRQTPKF
ncbi:hypothetical protein JCM15519_13020 [Fundidesulfovibrio butyratiphilus]